MKVNLKLVLSVLDSRLENTVSALSDSHYVKLFKGLVILLTAISIGLAIWQYTVIKNDLERESINKALAELNQKDKHPTAIGRNLTYLASKGIDLTSFDLSHVNLGGIFDDSRKEIRAIQLSESNLSASSVIQINFVGFNMEGTNFIDTQMYFVDFEARASQEAVLDFSSFFSSHLNSIQFVGASFMQSSFAYAVLTDITFNNSTLTTTDFSHTHLSNVRFRATNFEDVLFLNTTFDAVTFKGSKLDGVVFFQPIFSNEHVFKNNKGMFDGVELGRTVFKFADRESVDCSIFIGSLVAGVEILDGDDCTTILMSNSLELLSNEVPYEYGQIRDISDFIVKQLKGRKISLVSLVNGVEIEEVELTQKSIGYYISSDAIRHVNVALTPDGSGGVFYQVAINHANGYCSTFSRLAKYQVGGIYKFPSCEIADVTYVLKFDQHSFSESLYQNTHAPFDMLYTDELIQLWSGINSKLTSSSSNNEQ